MLFSLPNVPKKSLRDEDGALAVMPRLLKGRAQMRLIEQAIDHFETSLGKPRSQYDPRSLESILGNYRLGRCIEACLLTHYSFVQPSLDSLLSGEQLEALASQGLDGPSPLRLALWDWMNERHGGFAPRGSRAEVLTEFASHHALPPDPALLDALLSLDSEGSTVLTREGEKTTAADVVLQYNRGAVKTLLAHSTRIIFSLRQVPGAALKRTYFVAKRRGVLVDVEQDSSGFVLTLYGPEQASGGADRYGLRLADVALSLLRSLLSEVGGEAVSGATAYLVMHDREYRFHVTPEILERLEYAPQPEAAAKTKRVAERGVAYSVGAAVEPTDGVDGDEPLFDSLLEAKLYRELKSLERQGYTHGWELLREPDPLLAPGVVMIPDFAFRRGEAFVFMEIAGFWTPAYRERKLAKLQALAAVGETTPLILAVPLDSAQAYGSLPYPVVPYKTTVRATDLLTLLNTHYGERERRQDAAQAGVEGIRAEAIERGFIPEWEVADALQAYSRTELLEGARGLDDEKLLYVGGVGLFSRALLTDVETRLKSALESAGGRIAVDDAASIVTEAIGTPGADVESLAQALTGLSIERPSLFEAYVVGV